MLARLMLRVGVPNLLPRRLQKGAGPALLGVNVFSPMQSEEITVETMFDAGVKKIQTKPVPHGNGNTPLTNAPSYVRLANGASNSNYLATTPLKIFWTFGKLSVASASSVSKVFGGESLRSTIISRCLAADRMIGRIFDFYIRGVIDLKARVIQQTMLCATGFSAGSIR